MLATGTTKFRTMSAQGPTCALARVCYVESTRPKTQKTHDRRGPFLRHDMAHFYSAIDTQPWYFLPKSVEILFQQSLMTALVVALAAQNLRLGQIALLTAILFGGFHLTLALDGANPFYVLRYTVAATLFGAITPYQMLKMRNGFVYSFSLHWGWYALDTTIWRFLFPAL